ncbi:MAG: penicillin-binding transpeptidase domain-containing protein [Acidimicrobiia bacterium]
MAIATALATLVALGLWAVFARPAPEPAEPVPTILPPPPSTTAVEPTTFEPSVIILADGTEIASIRDGGALVSLRGHNALVDFLLRRLVDDPEFWAEDGDGSRALGLSPARDTGLTVRLTIDPAVQEIVEEAIGRWLDDPETFISVVVIDNETGGVLAAGPASQITGEVFYPERRLPAGSLAQVYTTVAALEAGMSLDSTWDASSPQTFTSEDWPDEWTVRNAGTSRPPITLEQALYQAVNTVFAAVGIEVGPEAVIDSATRLGANLTGTETAEPPPAVAIGAGTLDTFDATAMFSTLSREGVLARPTLVESITNADGDVLYEAPRAREVTVDPQVVAQVRQPLREVTTIRGTAGLALSGFDQSLEPIGKTGTAQEFTNAWYVGSTDRYTVAVAVGATDGASLVDVEFNGQLYARVFGGSVPAPIWAEIVSELYGMP